MSVQDGAVPGAADDDRRLELFRSLHGIARTGLYFCRDQYDRERYEQVERIAAELLAFGTRLSEDELRHDWAAETGYVTPKVEVRGAVFRPEDEPCCSCGRRWTGGGRCPEAGPT
jgi:hypothetical protein